MKQSPPNPSFLQRSVAAWDRFWFTPADPTLLGFIRICVGMIVVYTLFAYTFHLEEFMGKDGWYNLELRSRVVHDRPNQVPPLTGRPTNMHVKPANEQEEHYAHVYFEEFKEPPLAPYPEDQAQADFSIRFRKKYKWDARYFGLPLPRNEKERKYVEEYTAKWNKPPPPPYPQTEAEANEYDRYLETTNGQADPRMLYARGLPAWSLWFHLTDPTAMMVVHCAIIIVAMLFTLGFCTRITSVLIWMCQLFYIQRTPVIMFGVDTMTTIVLMYLMIGPSGAAFSLDRLIGRWWAQSKSKVIARWKTFWGKSVEAESISAPEYTASPTPTVSANIAIRLLQIHVCIIYLAAGLTKLQGAAWWNGTAVWGTVANYEFAPMDWSIYVELLKLLGRHQAVFETAFTLAAMFTLVFEIAYAFLVWRPATRWVILSMAIILHGFIGLFMGLKTFSLVMLVMNMAFLMPNEVKWIVRRLAWLGGGASKGKVGSKSSGQAVAARL